MFTGIVSFPEFIAWMYTMSTGYRIILPWPYLDIMLIKMLAVRVDSHIAIVTGRSSGKARFNSFTVTAQPHFPGNLIFRPFDYNQLSVAVSE